MAIRNRIQPVPRFAIPAAVTAMSIALALGITTTAVGQIVPIDQSRFVRTFVNASQCGGNFLIEERQAKNVPLFQAMLRTQHGCEGGAGIASAGQRSRISRTTLAGIGGATSEGRGPDRGVVHAFGHSTFDVTFELTSTKEFELTGLVTASSTENVILAGASVRLAAENGATIFSASVEPGPNGERVTERFNERLRLDAGRYRLLVSADTVMDNSIPPDGTADAAWRFRMNVVGQ